MNTEKRIIEVSDIKVEVVRKNIKNLHLGVYPPEGRVRVSAPFYLDDETVRLAVVSRLSWIRKQQKSFEMQARQSAREMVSGESHYFLGRKYLLDVIKTEGKQEIRIVNNKKLQMKVKPETSREKRYKLLQDWYRKQLKELLPDFVNKWEKKIGVNVNKAGIRIMKTKWGSCNPEAARIWLNLELAKKPVKCIEYILVHEMIHLLERRHNDRFRELLDDFLPDWRLRKDELNQAPLSHEKWDY